MVKVAKFKVGDKVTWRGSQYQVTRVIFFNDEDYLYGGPQYTYELDGQFRSRETELTKIL